MNQGGFSSPGFNNSQSGASPGIQQKKNQSLAPLTIKQAKEAKHNGESYVVDDKSVNQIRIVGLILSVDIQATANTYNVDDGSGSIPVRIYRSDDTQELNSECREDIYVSVIGNIRDIGGTKMVVAFTVTPLKDFNQITLHMLDCIYTHLKNTKGSLDEQGQPVQKHSATPMLASSSVPQYGASDSMNQDGMEKHQADVLKIFETHSKGSEQGTSISEVCSKLPNYSPQQIRDAVDFLSGEGHLYSTIDEEHYKCTSD
eukprot:CAMPEP_0197520616 /NCGR_PEP_ID=MMETSP1318-20131121/5965_1 /TAXON_ID=552666 /ORGANISM="Partenskyella glossopodia, Strain RCC365" /LENGTH=257 /DNA_ID=CAMNT_0043072281 /DNA_START=44 /DNA_END=817 /DNA_ORIENTATION=+